MLCYVILGLIVVACQLPVTIKSALLVFLAIVAIRVWRKSIALTARDAVVQLVYKQQDHWCLIERSGESRYAQLHKATCIWPSIVFLTFVVEDCAFNKQFLVSQANCSYRDWRRLQRLLRQEYLLALT